MLKLKLLVNEVIVILAAEEFQVSYFDFLIFNILIKTKTNEIIK